MLFNKVETVLRGDWGGENGKGHKERDECVVASAHCSCPLSAVYFVSCAFAVSSHVVCKGSLDVTDGG